MPSSITLFWRSQTVSQQSLLIMQRLLLTLTLSLFLFSHQANAQELGFSEGLVITNENDTLIGQIRERTELKTYKGVIFISEEGERKFYYPNELKAYYVDGTYFESHPLNNLLKSNAFFKLQVIGKILVFSHKYWQDNGQVPNPNGQMIPSGGTIVTRYYIKREGESELTKLKPIDFRKKLSKYISDNKMLSKVVKKANFKYDDIPSTIEYYNKGYQ